MTQTLAYAETVFGKFSSLGTLLAIPDNAEVGYIVEVHSKFPDEIKEKTKYSSLCPESKLVDQSLFRDCNEK